MKRLSLLFILFFVACIPTLANAAGVACKKCHKPKFKKSKTSHNHPNAIYPPEGITIPAGFNLDESGKISCLTCHQDHGDDGNGKPLSPSNGEFYLVSTPQDIGFCESCHKDHREKAKLHLGRDIAPEHTEKLSVMGGIGQDGKMVCRTCHTAHGTPSSDLIRAENVKKAKVLISVCLACHPGDKGQEHSVKKGSLSIPKKYKNGVPIKKFKKSLTCSSCHQLHNPVPGTPHLSEAVAKSELCVACHKNKYALLFSKHNMALQESDSKNIKGKSVAESGPCSSCHTVHGGSMGNLWARTLPAGKDTISRMCDSCHQDISKEKNSANSLHPLDMNMTGREMAKKLPLFDSKAKKDKAGNVTCATCHNVHQWDPGKKTPKKPQDIDKNGDAQNSFLRIANNGLSKLCLNCHREQEMIVNTVHDIRTNFPDEQNMNDKTSLEAGVCSACHAVHNTLDLYMWSRQLPSKGDISASFCHSCHNSRDIGFQKVLTDHSHPLSISLIEAGMTTTLPTYNAGGNKLDDANITCSTCHDVHKWNPAQTQRAMKPPNPRTSPSTADNKFLRIPNKESKLCTNCHKKQGFIFETPHDLRISAPEELNTLGQNPEQGGPCSACHLVHNSKQKSIWAKDFGYGSDLISMRCLSCHDQNKVAQTKAVGFNDHPVNLNLSKDITNSASTLPLYNDYGKVDISGKILCTTCHDVHQWAPSELLMQKMAEEDKVVAIPDKILKKGLVGTIAFIQGEFTYIDITTKIKVEPNDKLTIIRNKQAYTKVKVMKINPFAKTFEIFASVLDKKVAADLRKGDIVIHSKILSAGKRVNGDGRNSFLRKDNSKSALCLECHPDFSNIIDTPHDLSKNPLNIVNVKQKSTLVSGVCSSCHLSHNGKTAYMFAPQY